METITIRKLTPEQWVDEMKKVHPKLWMDFQAGIDSYRAGTKRPYDNWHGQRLSKGKELYQLGWDIGRSADVSEK